MKRKSLVIAAKKKMRAIATQRKDPRFLKTLGKLKKAGLIDAPGIRPTQGMVFLEDAIWAGKVEPRIWELLPAIIVKQPKFFAFSELPKDLSQIARELKNGKPTTPYQGFAPEIYTRWLPFVGRKGKIPSVMRSFRFHKEDLETLKVLQEKSGLSQTALIRKAVNKMAETFR